MANPISTAGAHKNLSASANITSRAGELVGVFVASASSSPTLAFYDSATTTTTSIIVNTFTPVAGTFYPLPFSFADGCYVVVGGTLDCTVSLRAN